MKTLNQCEPKSKHLGNFIRINHKISIENNIFLGLWLLLLSLIIHKKHKNIVCEKKHLDQYIKSNQFFVVIFGDLLR
jgi:hypothetical protein